jgi:hypothetical protein
MCGERDFVRLVKRRQGDVSCYDCQYNHSGAEERAACARCHGFGYVVVFTAQSIDSRTGKRGHEWRAEVAPDAWEAEQFS